MSERPRTAMFVSSLLLAMLVAASAKAVTIDFDDVATAGFTQVAADHYRPQGIVFDGLIPVQNLALGAPTFHDDVFVPAGGTTPNTMSLSLPLGGDLDIEGTFVLPGTSTPGVTDLVQVLVFDTEVGTSLGTLEAYDSFGGLLQSVSMTTPVSQHAVYTISMPGIAGIRFVQDSDGGSFDNLVFNTPVPEPSTAFLLAFGQLSLAAARRRSRHRPKFNSGRDIPANVQQRIVTSTGSRGPRTSAQRRSPHAFLLGNEVRTFVPEPATGTLLGLGLLGLGVAAAVRSASTRALRRRRG